MSSNPKRVSIGTCGVLELVDSFAEDVCRFPLPLSREADAKSDFRRATATGRRGIRTTVESRAVPTGGRVRGETIRKSTENRSGRATWTKAVLTIDSIAATARPGPRTTGRESDFSGWSGVGRARTGLIYKTLVLTGLRKGTGIVRRLVTRPRCGSPLPASQCG